MAEFYLGVIHVMPAPEDRLVIMILVLLALLFGVLAVVWALRRIWFSWRSFWWPCEVGVITRSKAVKRQCDSEPGVWFAPEVEYSFEVGRQLITGSAFHFGFEETFGTRSEAERRAAKFPVGSQVSVTYDPGKPSRCAIEPNKFDLTIYLLAIIGLAFAVLGVLAFVEELRRR